MMKSLQFVFLLFACVPVLTADNGSANNNVTGPSPVYATVSTGALQGYLIGENADAAADEVNFGGRKFCVFKRVPIAEPPTGALRFAPLQPHHSWSGIRSAGRQEEEEDGTDGNQELTTLFSEHENVTIVADESCFRQRGPKCAVLLRLGYSATKPPDARLGAKIVLVDAPIRRGVFGWLSFDVEKKDKRERETVPPKNLAIHDALYVLRWVNAEIANFGGDPGRVTLAGAGAVTGSIVAVLLALRQPPTSIGRQRKSGDLFAQALAVDASPQLTDDANHVFTTALVYHANCAVNSTASNVVSLNTTEQLACLRALSATRLLELQREVETRLGVDTFPTGFDRCEILTADSYADMLADIKERNIWISTINTNVNGSAEVDSTLTSLRLEAVRIEVECQSAETIFGYTSQFVHDACVYRASRQEPPLRTARTAVAALIALANTRRGGTSYLSVVGGTEADSQRESDSDENAKEYMFNGNELVNRFVRTGRPDPTHFPPSDEWSRGFLAVRVDKAEEDRRGSAVGRFVNGYANLDALRFWLYDAPRAERRSNADDESRSSDRPPWAIRCRHCKRDYSVMTTTSAASNTEVSSEASENQRSSTQSSRKPHENRPSSASTLRERWWKRKWRQLSNSWRNRRAWLHDGEKRDLRNVRKRNGESAVNDNLPAWWPPLDDGAKQRDWRSKQKEKSEKHNRKEELPNSNGSFSERWWNDAEESENRRTRQRFEDAKRKFEDEKAKLHSKLAEKRQEVNETIERGRKRISERMKRLRETWKEGNKRWWRISSTTTESPSSSEDKQSGTKNEDGSRKNFFERLKDSWSHRHEQIYGKSTKVDDGSYDSRQEDEVKVTKRIADYKEKLKTKVDEVEARAKEKRKDMREATNARLAEGVAKVREKLDDAKQGRRNITQLTLALAEVSLDSSKEGSGNGDDGWPFYERWWNGAKDSYSHEQIYGTPNGTKQYPSEIEKRASILRNKLDMKMKALEAKAEEQRNAAKEAVDDARKTAKEGLEKVHERVEEAKQSWHDIVYATTTESGLTSAKVSGDEEEKPFFKRWWDDVKRSWDKRHEQIYGNRNAEPENEDERGRRHKEEDYRRQWNTVLAPFGILLAAPPPEEDSSHFDAASNERAAKPTPTPQEHTLAGLPPTLQPLSQQRNAVNNMSGAVWSALLVALLAALAVFAAVFLRSALQPSEQPYAYMATDDGFFSDERTKILGDGGGGKRRSASATTVPQTSTVPKYVVFD